MKTMKVFLMTAVWVALLPGCSSVVTDKADRVDLTSPEASVVSFTKAAVRGQADLAQRCFLPGGVDYEDIREVLTAKPGTPQYEMRKMLESIDIDAAMPIIAKETRPGGTKVIWRVTFLNRFQAEKNTVFEPGSTYDLDATLKLSNGQWLIDNF